MTRFPTSVPRRQWVEGDRHYLCADTAAGLRAARLRLGLSLRGAAALTSVSAGHLSKLEHGQRCPSADVAQALIDGLQLDSDLAARLLAEARYDAGRNGARRSGSAHA
jgi:transcriptional regulator with XRE-family HTH domain